MSNGDDQTEIDLIAYVERDLAELKGIAFGIDCELEHSMRQRSMIRLIDGIRKNFKTLTRRNSNGENAVI